MPRPGHRPVSNGDARPEAALLPEAVGAPLANRPSLPYYRPLRARPRTLDEAAILGADPAAPAAPALALPDVAVASFGDTPLLEAVIGNDDRVKVAREFLSRNPWRQICALRIRSRSNQLYVGTGWFIGARTLATAGHCVFLQDDGGWAVSIDVIPAKFGTAEPFGTMRATRFAAVDGWTVRRQRDFDYGAIHLEDAAAGRQVGNFAVRSFADAQVRAMAAKISGYPADRERAEFQYFHERPVQNVTGTRLFYDVDTFGGQSGSPIWADTAEHGLVAVGIHTTGGLSSNSGTRINDDVLDNLISWLEA